MHLYRYSSFCNSSSTNAAAMVLSQQLTLLMRSSLVSKFWVSGQTLHDSTFFMDLSGECASLELAANRPRVQFPLKVPVVDFMKWEPVSYTHLSLFPTQNEVQYQNFYRCISQLIIYSDLKQEWIIFVTLSLIHIQMCIRDR